MEIETSKEEKDLERLEKVAQIEGHKLDVNSVVSNPVYLGVLASCSDDRTIKIWEVSSKGDLNQSDSKNGKNMTNVNKESKQEFKIFK